MFRQVSLTTLVRPLLFLAILFVAMVLYLSERQNAIDRQVNRKMASLQNTIPVSLYMESRQVPIVIELHHRFNDHGHIDKKVSQ